MMILPGNTLGVLGGGQLGRMFAQAAHQLGYRVHIFEPAEDCPAGEVATREINADYRDAEALARFVGECAAVTYEFENVPVEPLWAIEKATQLRPHWSILETCQNRLREKTWLQKKGFPHVPFAEVGPIGKSGEVGDLAAAIKAVGLPCVVKTADFGYDGKGQRKISEPGEIPAAVEAFAGARVVVEKFIDFKCEVSVIVARNPDGEIRTFPIAENIHTRHILDISLVPARISPELAARVARLGEELAEAFKLVGLLAVELFIGDDDSILINEMAPRPHNSGHYTLDGCVTSQFEQHVRAVAGLPLGSTALQTPIAMVNILGDAWQWSGDTVIGPPNWAAILAQPHAKLHLYGKAEPRRARKMGHFTVTGATTTEALAAAAAIKAALTAQP